MRFFNRILLVMAVLFISIFLIESKNREEYNISASGIDTSVITWHSAPYDSMGNWDVNNGSVILEVDYANAKIDSDATISKIILEGLAIFSDGKTENFNKKCERKWSTKLDQLPDIPTNAFSSDVHHDPVCYMIFDHSLSYKRKSGERMVSESKEQKRVMAEVLKTKISNFKVSVWARKKPTKLERDIRQKLALTIEWLKIPFERS